MRFLVAAALANPPLERAVSIEGVPAALPVRWPRDMPAAE